MLCFNVCVLCKNSAHKTRSGHQILWKWSWRWSLTTMRILGLESRPSEGATTNFNCWAISPALVLVFKSPLPFYKDLLMSIAITTHLPYLFLKVLNFILGPMRKIDYEGEGGFTVIILIKRKLLVHYKRLYPNFLYQPYILIIFHKVKVKKKHTES